ncbi:PEP/pyruvate-binding domain-containing protein [Spelaeicoccus albus]|uniref:Pyruvate,water dikinase n=1 Tax=Spelaeicoccus albus TaxID=1280376 RepID=A0A7Z0A893_9MICO|nr:PEP/pyruvate-binding domain-containing protein [Spelaeicoccus albus]NYI66239.1 pyruvate,water dikinase [Spelaeicoccus albus]
MTITRHTGADDPEFTPRRSSPSASPLGTKARPPLIASLDSLGAKDLPIAGGKGANLGELTRAGFPVPGGFVVTTAAYDLMLTETGIGADLKTRVGADGDGSALRREIASSAMPGAVADGIRAAYAGLGEGAVAVRSSATAEDLPGAAFAGQQDTYLNIKGPDDVIDAVARCWASLWTDRAISYRARQGVAADHVSIAVVVQRMVPSEFAGVMFSANPVTGDRSQIVVDASRGLGESVVSGLVTPEHFVLDSNNQIDEWRAGGNEAVISGLDDGGTDEVAGTPSATQELPNSALTRLAELGRSVESHFGRPQDMEWALADGEVRLVQARPMTALPPEQVDLNAFQRKVGPFFFEMLQTRPTPLDASGWMDRGIVKMVRDMAASVAVRFPDMPDFLPETDGVIESFIPPVPRPTLRSLGAPASLARRIKRYKPAHWQRDARFAKFLSAVAELRRRDVGALSWRDLTAMPSELFAAMDVITQLRIDYLPGSFAPAGKLRAELAALRRSDLASALVAGAPTQTRAANDALNALAEMVRDDERLSKAFTELQGAELLKLLRGAPEFDAFNTALTALLDRFGHRETVSPLLVSEPTWRSDPTVVLGLVKVLADTPPDDTVDRTATAIAELARHPALRNPKRRRQVLDTIEAARLGLAFREDSHFYGTQVLPILQDVFAEIGRRLVARHVIEAPQEVYLFKLDELEAIDDVDELTASDVGRLSDLAMRRTAIMAGFAGVPLINVLSFSPDRTAPDGVRLSATPASGGTATGPVRVIRAPSEFGELRSGDILVCPYTNPAWTPLFQRAAAVVVDTGGLGSHAAIVAREYGIPAVMGTGSGTSVLVDGERITVDGDLGFVVNAEDATDAQAGPA